MARLVKAMVGNTDKMGPKKKTKKKHLELEFFVGQVSCQRVRVAQET